jgi:hypothetical protein
VLWRGFPGHSGCTAPARAGAAVSGVVPGAVRAGRSPSLGRVLYPGFGRPRLTGPSGADLPQQIVKCADRRDPCAEEASNSCRDPIGGSDNEDNTADNFGRCHVGPDAQSMGTT